MNEISTKLYRINFKYLLENVLDRAMWKKSWTVYDYDGCRINLRLSNIDVINESVNVRIYSTRSTYLNYFSGTNSQSISLPLADAHFNEVVFYQKVLSAIEDVLAYEERDLLRATDAYETARRLEGDVDTRNAEIAKQLCIDRGLDEEADEEIINAYAEKYVSDKQAYYCSDMLSRMKYVAQSQRYLMLAYQFEKNCPKISGMLLSRVQDKIADDSLEEVQQRVEKAFALIEEEEMEDAKLDDVLDRIVEEESEEEDEETDT